MEAVAALPAETVRPELLERRPIVAGRGRLICVANQKGGVAKTTTAVNLAAALALRGHPVLVVDVDPQANATTGLGIDHREGHPSTYEVLGRDVAWSDAVRPTTIRGLDVVPASVHLAGAEVELVAAMARERTLADALQGVEARYEMIFLDCPPSLGLLTVNALVAAHDLIVPVQCEYYALEGLGQLLETAERVRRGLNPELRIAGFLLTMFDGRTRLSMQVAADVRRHFGDFVFETLIPRSVRLSEAPSFGEPVLTLDPSSRGAVAYRLLAAETEAAYGLAPPAPPPAPAPRRRPPPPPPPKTAARGPGGRGFGVASPRPPGLERSWPPAQPWLPRGDS